MMEKTKKDIITGAREKFLNIDKSHIEKYLFEVRKAENGR